MIVVISALLYFFSQASFAESDGAFTGYEKIIDTAFPASQLERNYQKPSPVEAQTLENVRGTLVQLIQTVRSSWMSTIAGGAFISDSDQRAVIEVLKTTPVYICEKKCGCSSGIGGCAKGRPVGDAMAAILTLEACVFSDKGCVGDVNRKQGLERRLIQFFENGFYQIAYWKLNGMKSFTMGPNKKDREKVRVIFDDAVSRMSQLRSSCPRKFPEWGFQFLKSTQSLSETGIPQAKCTQKILSAFKGARFSQACMKVIRPETFQKEFKENLFRNGFKVANCDSNCAMMTCGVSPEKDARLIRFGEKNWVALIPASLCEGQFPVYPEMLIKNALEWLGNGSESERSKCAAEMYNGPVFNREKTEGKSGFLNDFELIPMESN